MVTNAYRIPDTTSDQPPGNGDQFYRKCSKRQIGNLYDADRVFQWFTLKFKLLFDCCLENFEILVWP